MNIIDHGKWRLYKPEKRPELIPDSVLFATREGDGVDWYEYSRNPDTFKSNSVKFLATYHEIPSGGGGWLIGAAVRDVSMLFPANAIVGEILDFAGADPQRELRQHFFDPETKILRPWPQPPGQRKNPIELVWELEKRVEALEKRVE